MTKEKEDKKECKNECENESKNKDLYCGNAIQVWDDGELVYVNLYSNACTLTMTREDWNSMKSEIDECGYFDLRDEEE